MSTLLCTYCHLYVFFGKMFIQFLCPLIVNNLVICFFCCWVEWITSVLCVLISYRIYGLQVILPFHRLPFHFLNVFLCQAELFSWIESSFFIFAFVSFVFSVKKKKILPRPVSKELTHMFCFRSFVVSCRTFRSLIYLELIFMCGVKIGVQFHSFVRGNPVFPSSCISETIFFPLYILGFVIN